jgi:hypothetical protein
MLSTLAHAGPSLPADAAAEIASLPPGGAWTREVARILLRHDADRSGALDQGAEVRAVSCSVWQAIDAGVRRDWRGHGVLPMYGFAPGQLYVGDALGVHASQAETARQAIEACGTVPAVTQPPSAPAVPSTNNLIPPPASIATAIDSLSDGGSDAWDQAVRRLLIATYDRDHDDILGVDETRALPCPVWQAINRGVRSGWDDDVGIVYGFRDGLIWIGGALGLQDDARRAADEAVNLCLGAPPIPGTLRI